MSTSICKAKDPKFCRYHTSLQKQEQTLLQKIHNLFSGTGRSELPPYPDMPTTLERSNLLKTLENIEINPEDALRELGQLQRPADKVSHPNQDLGFNYYPLWAYVPSKEKYNQDLEEANEQLYKQQLNFTAPESKLAEALGFKSHRLNKDTELLQRSYGYHIPEEDFSGEDSYKMENFLVYKGVPVAYCEYAYVKDKPEIPPIIFGVEVQKQYRGFKLGSKLKAFINTQLSTRLHSDNIYTREGLKHMEKSPIWDKLKNKEPVIVDTPIRFVRKWNILMTSNVENF